MWGLPGLPLRPTPVSTFPTTHLKTFPNTINPMRVVYPTRHVNSYPQILRAPMGHRIFGKEYMPQESFHRLFKIGVIAEELMDGKHTMARKNNLLFFAEDLKITRRIHYKIPGRYAVFDVFDECKGAFINADERTEFLRDINRRKHLLPYPLRSEGMFPVPVFSMGVSSPEELPKLISHSFYAVNEDGSCPAHPEGMVLKTIVSFSGPSRPSVKIITTEFLEGTERKPFSKSKKKTNVIDTSMEWITGLEA